MILLLHGGPGLKRDYLVKHFAKWRGDAVLSFEYPENARLSAVLDFIRTAAPAGGAFDVIAHSWGAFLLMELLKRDIHWTSGRLVLVAPFLTSWKKFQECEKTIDRRIQERISTESIRRLEALTTDQGGPKDLEYVKILEPLYVGDSRHAALVGFDYYNRAVEEKIHAEMKGFDHGELIKRIKNKTLLILGKSDFIHIENLQPWESVASRIELMEGVGHCPYLEAPRPFFRILDEFLG